MPATFETVKEVTLHYDGKSVTDGKYPFEFTIPVDGDGFEFELEVTDINGHTQRSPKTALQGRK